MVLANLRKRVAACDLTKRRVTEDPNANDTGQIDQQLDNRPLLPKVRYIVHYFIGITFFFILSEYPSHVNDIQQFPNN